MNTLPSGDYESVEIDPSNGKLYIRNSSRRYKKNIRPLDDDFSLILKAQPKTYTRPDRWELGYIAEEMDSLGLTKLVNFNADGQAEGFNYDIMVLYLTEMLKTHHQELATKDGEIADLKKGYQLLQQEVDALRAVSQTQSDESVELKQRMAKLEAALLGLANGH